MRRLLVLVGAREAARAVGDQVVGLRRAAVEAARVDRERHDDLRAERRDVGAEVERVAGEVGDALPAAGTGRRKGGRQGQHPDTQDDD
jgi:hypothetical protein